MPVRFIIKGAVCSKANSRRLVTHPRTGRAMFVKSKAALAWLKQAEPQIPKLPALMLGPVRVSIKIFYPSERNDLDASLVLDAMQERVFANDRQCREIHLYHGVDARDPRAVVEVSPMQSDFVAEAA